MDRRADGQMMSNAILADRLHTAEATHETVTNWPLLKRCSFEYIAA